MRLIWSALARRDILRIFDYYWTISPDLAAELVARVEAAPLILLSYPNLGTDSGRDRKWNVPGTPFILLFRSERRAVRISRVHDARENWFPG